MFAVLLQTLLLSLVPNEAMNVHGHTYYLRYKNYRRFALRERNVGSAL